MRWVSLINFIKTCLIRCLSILRSIVFHQFYQNFFYQVLIHFEKHYRRRHSVDYEGYFSPGFKRIIGTYFNGSDTFEMDFKEPILDQNTKSNEKKCAQLFSNFRNFFTQQASKQIVDIFSTHIKFQIGVSGRGPCWLHNCVCWWSPGILPYSTNHILTNTRAVIYI